MGQDQDDVEHDDPHTDHLPAALEPVLPEGVGVESGDWDWEMPPNVIDSRHQDALQAAREGRCSEAADLAALGERQDIAAHGINSDQAVSWLVTRAKVAVLCGNLDQATQLRATVARMGKVEWFEQPEGARTEPQWHSGPGPAAPEAPTGYIEPVKKQRRMWPYAATVAALAVGIAVVWQNGSDDKEKQAHAEKAAAYKGLSAVTLDIDGVATEASADWSKDGTSVVLSVWVASKEKPKFVRIDSGDQKAQEELAPLKEGQFAMPTHLEVKVPVKDRYQPIQMTVAVGGPHWKKNTRAPGRTIEFRPDRTAIDAETGKPLKQYYTRLF